MTRTREVFMVLLGIVVVAFVMAGLWIIAFSWIFPEPIYSESRVPHLDPDVYRSHLARFGEFHYMTERDLRALLRAARKRRSTAFVTDQILEMTTWYNDERFVWEKIESFGIPSKGME